MPWSWVDTKYSIHQVQHTPSTAYTEYSIHRVPHTPRTASYQDWMSHSQSLSSQRTMLYSILYVPTITSQAMNWVWASIAHASRSTASRFAPSRLTASRLTTFSSIASRSITSKYSSNLDWSWPPSASPNSLGQGLRVRTIMSSY